jgi:hypothetical protein
MSGGSGRERGRCACGAKGSSQFGVSDIFLGSTIWSLLPGGEVSLDFEGGDEGGYVVW